MCVCVGLMVSLVSCLVIVRSLQLVSILCIVLAQVLMIFLATPPRNTPLLGPSSSTSSFVGSIGYLVYICYLVRTISAVLVYIRFLI